MARGRVCTAPPPTACGTPPPALPHCSPSSKERDMAFLTCLDLQDPFGTGRSRRVHRDAASPASHHPSQHTRAPTAEPEPLTYQAPPLISSASSPTSANPS